MIRFKLLDNNVQKNHFKCVVMYADHDNRFIESN